MSKLNLSRRQFISVSAASMGLYSMSNIVLGQNPLPSRDDSGVPFIGLTDVGPFYPPGEIPWLSDLTSAGNSKPSGEILYLFGQILDSKARPVEGATVEIWQADNNGLYKHPRAGNQDNLDPGFGYFGRVKSAQDGTYLFKTILPRWYNVVNVRRANHIHLTMRRKDLGVLTTQIYFEGKEQDEIRKYDPVFKSHIEGDRLIVAKESPEKYSALDVEFEKKAICCMYDLAFY